MSCDFGVGGLLVLSLAHRSLLSSLRILREYERGVVFHARALLAASRARA